jgi:hypothetical protein
MSDREGYEPGVPVRDAGTRTRERLTWRVTATPPGRGGAASKLSQLVIASLGA